MTTYTFVYKRCQKCSEISSNLESPQDWIETLSDCHSYCVDCWERLYKETGQCICPGCKKDYTDGFQLTHPDLVWDKKTRNSISEEREDSDIFNYSFRKSFSKRRFGFSFFSK